VNALGIEKPPQTSYGPDVRNTFPGSVKLHAGSGALRAPFTVWNLSGLWDVVASTDRPTVGAPRTS